SVKYKGLLKTQDNGIRRHEERKIKASSVIPWGKVSLLGGCHEHYPPSIVTVVATFIGNDYHKKGSV
ncbi:MAG: hypothetical protein LDL31_00815, partial [Prosthecobacter sp.]|nr:hypothetical protein [Prosthecobacter sp.]